MEEDTFIHLIHKDTFNERDRWKAWAESVESNPENKEPLRVMVSKEGEEYQ